MGKRQGRVKIAYLMGQTVSGRANGVRVQAETWAAALNQRGHDVAFVSPWGDYDWRSFDILHFFGYSDSLDPAPRLAIQTRAAIIVSPIIDTTRSYFLEWIASHMCIPCLHMYSPPNRLRRVDRLVASYFVRSDYEGLYLRKSFGIAASRVEKVHLAVRFDAPREHLDKEPFCLHVSILSSKNKNVKRLIEAAIKYKFRLVLAGRLGEPDWEKYIAEVCKQHGNVEFRGFLEDEALKSLFRKARVFALPSLFEGVGMVALEAAVAGSDIVLTNVGAPKEYYDGLAALVDPLDIDAIGIAISRMLNGETRQPALRDHISANFSTERIGEQLLDAYERVLRPNVQKAQ